MRGIYRLLTVAGRSALEELYRLHDEYASSGLYPVLLGDLEDYKRIQDGLAGSHDVSATLAKSNDIDPNQWLRERSVSDPDLYQIVEGEWPETTSEEMGIGTHLNVLTGLPKKYVMIALLRVAAPWEVFARLNWGGWNDCPFPAEHCAMQRYWALQYGAEVVSVTGDIVQCVVKTPPTDREKSLHLAREQSIYCYDIVQQGVGSIAALAAGLLDSRFWYFWWD
jgi:hypothetical protein